MKAIRPYFEQLDALYLALLGRNIDRSGYFTYASLLESGQGDLMDIEQILMQSEEYRAKHKGRSENS